MAKPFLSRIQAFTSIAAGLGFFVAVALELFQNDLREDHFILTISICVTIFVLWGLWVKTRAQGGYSFEKQKWEKYVYSVFIIILLGLLVGVVISNSSVREILYLIMGSLLSGYGISYGLIKYLDLLPQSGSDAKN